MQQIFDFFNMILNFKFEIPLDLANGIYLPVTAFGIIIVFISFVFAAYIIHKLTK